MLDADTTNPAIDEDQPDEIPAECEKRVNRKATTKKQDDEEDDADEPQDSDSSSSSSLASSSSRVSAGKKKSRVPKHRQRARERQTRAGGKPAQKVQRKMKWNQRRKRLHHQREEKDLFPSIPVDQLLNFSRTLHVFTDPKHSLISLYFSNTRPKHYVLILWHDSQGNVVSKLSASITMQMDSFDPSAGTKGPKAKRGKT